tara:strand:- start:163 stop:1005 length:843 start_codon:yes stop_codon:yes gene_type:complete
MKIINKNISKAVNEISSEGYCVVKNVITKKKSDQLIKSLEKTFIKTQKNNFFSSELSEYGQVVIRDLVLRDPKAFLNIIDNKFVMKVLENIFKDKFILDNIMASNSVNVPTQRSLVHMDAHLPTKEFINTSDLVVFFCLNDFTKENGATKIWPKSHLSGIRVQNDKNYKNIIKKKFKFVEAPKGSCIFVPGQTWHQIGKNINSKDRWGIIIHYKRWWIKPSTDYTKCGSKIFKKLNIKQKELFGFNCISPSFNFKKQTRVLKTLRDVKKLSKNYKKVINI